MFLVPFGVGLRKLEKGTLGGDPDLINAQCVEPVEPKRKREGVVTREPHDPFFFVLIPSKERGNFHAELYTTICTRTLSFFFLCSFHPKLQSGYHDVDYFHFHPLPVLRLGECHGVVVNTYHAAVVWLDTRSSHLQMDTFMQHTYSSRTGSSKHDGELTRALASASAP